MGDEVRRLAALLLTDMVGYVSLTQQDERLALRLLDEHSRLLRPIFERHAGHLVKTIGDAFLVEFESALAAVECAIEVQRVLHDAERTRPQESVRVRIGVHVGDVIHRDQDVFGDAVNLLSRLTPLADPGGICLTEPVVEQVRQRIDYPCRPIELPPLRHVEFPVSACRVELPWLEEGGAFQSPWTDRHREMELLEHAFVRVLNGSSTAVVLAGEAGIGKTRLANEGIRRAREHGFRVLRGDFVGQPAGPYSAWATGLRPLLGEAPAPLLYKILGPYSAEISKLVPEAGERLGPATGRESADPDQGRRRLFDGVAHVLSTFSREGPLVIFLDDLQNADEASLHLFAHVVRSLRSDRVLVLGAFRDTEVLEDSALHNVLLDLGRERLVNVVHLDRLGPDEVRRLVEANYAGPTTDLAFAQAVFDRTGGNPFFVEELVRSLGAGTAPTNHPRGISVPTLPWPETVRRVLRQRLLRLPDETVRLLEIASVLGPSFRCDVLGELAETAEEPLLDALEGALRARVLTEARADHGPLTCAFADRQTRDLIYGGLSQIRTRRYHHRAAEVLERRYGAEAKEHAEELAHHWLEGEAADKALGYTLMAAERAASVYAREAAIGHYRTALDLAEERGPARVAPILEALSEQELYHGEVEECRRHLDRAGRAYEDAGNLGAAARVWLRSAHIYRWAFYDRAAAIERVERARRAVEGLPETGEVASVVAEVAERLVQEFRFAEARTEYRRALAIAERAGDSRTADNLRLSLVSLAPAEEVEATRAELLERWVPRATASRDPTLVRSTYGLAAEFLTEAYGDAENGAHCLEEAIRLLNEQGAVSSAVDLSGQDLAATELLRGHLREARRLAEEGYAYGVRNYPTPDAPNLAVLGELARIEGDRTRSRELFDRAVDLLRRSGARTYLVWMESLLLRLELDEGNFPAADARAERLLRAIDERETLPMFASTECRVLELAVRSALAVDHEAESRRRLEWLRRVADRLPGDPTGGFLRRGEAALLEHAREFPAAARRWREAADAFARLGWQVEECESREGLGRALDRAGDPDGARAATDRGTRLRESMGLPPSARGPSSVAA